MPHQTARWPFMDENWIMRASEPLPNGLYVIVSADSSGDIVATPDPVTV